jgi:hypothetical protein
LIKIPASIAPKSMSSMMENASYAILLSLDVKCVEIPLSVNNVCCNIIFRRDIVLNAINSLLGVRNV